MRISIYETNFWCYYIDILDIYTSKYLKLNYSV